MEHNRIALIASLDTKLQETLYAKHEIESCGGQGLIIDISTKPWWTPALRWGLPISWPVTG